MAKAEQRGPFSRRLQELEEEERLLRQSMKDVSRHLRKLERGEAEAVQARSSPGWGARPAQPVAEPPGDPPPALQQAVETPRQADPRGNERFASYFASGSFVKTKPLARARRNQRNRAIFIMIVVILAAYIVFHVVF